MGRDPVIGQTVPGREFEHIDIGGKESERARERRHPRAVAADDQQACCRRLGAGRDGTREIAEHEPFGAVGNPRQGQRAAGQEKLSGTARQGQPPPQPSPASGEAAATPAEVAQPAKQRRIVIGRYGLLARTQASSSGSGSFQHPLEIRELILGHLGDHRVGETPGNQIGFPHAAMPGAVQQPAPAHI